MINRTEQDIMKNWQSKEPPVVSVCCTTYNHENYISDAIEGFLIQETDFPFEIIVRDDCSTDKTAEVVKRYVEKYPNLIKPIYETENQFSNGVKPMPVVFKKAVGKYFALCEGDDYWTDALKLHKQLSIFLNNKKISLCFHSAKEINLSEKTNKIICKHFHENKVISTSDVILGRGGYMPTASLFFKNEKIDEMIRSFKDAPIGDYFIQMFMASLGDTFFIKDTMCIYRRNRIGSWTADQQGIIEWKIYSFSMIEALDYFSIFLKNIENKKYLYKVIIFYVTSYISCINGMCNKIIEIKKINKKLINYSSIFHRIWFVFLLKNLIKEKIKKYNI